MDEQPELYDAKADFTDIYNEPDPRGFFRTLGALSYEIPSHGPPVFDRLLDGLGGREGKTVLDVCCSYGVNAAVLNYEVDLDDMAEHYEEAGALDASELEALDREWFAKRRRDDAVRTVGIDVADHAVHYATSVGLLDLGVVANLEEDTVDGDDRKALGSADLVTVTGGIGYIGERTLRTVVEAAGDDAPWIAALSLRWLDFEPIAESLEGVGLVTEHVPSYCVPQRRFADEDERQAALAGLRRRGLDPSTELESGAHFAELFVLRPPEAVRDAPIGELLGTLVS